MMFFQLVLLAGYGYAHLLTARTASRQALDPWRRADRRRHRPALRLSVTSTAGTMPPRQSSLCGLPGGCSSFLACRFLPCRRPRPLLRKLGSPHRSSGGRRSVFSLRPSNLGSLVALLGVPLLLEPLHTLSLQSRLWMGVFAVLAAMVLACAGGRPGDPRRATPDSPAAIAMTTARCTIGAAARCGIALPLSRPACCLA